jgi:hypothetical protein
MIDFPISDLLDDEACTHWLQLQLHPEGLSCPYCRSAERRVARRGGPFVGYRCRGCDRYYTLLGRNDLCQNPADACHPGATLARDGQRRVDGEAGTGTETFTKAGHHLAPTGAAEPL